MFYIFLNRQNLVINSYLPHYIYLVFRFLRAHYFIKQVTSPRIFFNDHCSLFFFEKLLFCDSLKGYINDPFFIKFCIIYGYLDKKSRSNERLLIYNGIKDYLPSSIFLFNSANASMSPRVDLSSLFEEEDTFLEEDSLTFFFSSSLKIPV